MPQRTAGNTLVIFLNNYPNRTVLIEGYTDSVGSDDYNQELSSRRAESVQAYLVGQGIDRGRLTASGLGESAPVADNESATGRTAGGGSVGRLARTSGIRAR